MNKQQAFADVIVAVVGTLCIVNGVMEVSGIHFLDRFGLIWGGMCVGYLLTTYLVEEHDDDQA